MLLRDYREISVLGLQYGNLMSNEDLMSAKFSNKEYFSVTLRVVLSALDTVSDPVPGCKKQT